MTLENALQVLVVLLVIWKLYILGQKKRWGWILAVLTEAPWMYLALHWHAWGLVVLSVLYASLYARNWFVWGRA